MYSHLYSAAVYGIDAYIVDIETHLDASIPAFNLVGLPDSAVKESRDRVTAAIKNSDLIFPMKKITVNLAPADIRKEGSSFDLPIALGIIAAMDIINEDALKDKIILGELSLDGSLRPIKGALSIALEAQKKEYKQVILPEVNAGEAALVEGIEVIPVKNLRETVEYLRNDLEIAPHKVDVEKIFEESGAAHYFDLADVKGQENVKRALEVAAAGGHNLLMIGPPGSGKTMLAKRVPSILPPLSLEESLETTKIHSVAGILPENEPLITVRPFRAPHHTISDAALVGGGMNRIKPGEISLSHHGVLFLDELPEFARNVLEVLRQPLEDKRIVISRAKLSVEYPANFMLVCSLNPCPCGNYGDPNKKCICNDNQKQKYIGRISGPLLDRIDIHIEVPAVKYTELSSDRLGEASARVRERVITARKMQVHRFEKHKGVHKNADMGSRLIRKYCALDESSQELLKTAMNRLGLSARAYDRILKVARTIADLAGCENIKSEHLSEAIQYRSLDRDYWKMQKSAFA